MYVSVCLSVCLSTLILALQATRRPMQTGSDLQGPENVPGDSLETTAFGRYGVKTSEKANMIMSTRLQRYYL